MLEIRKHVTSGRHVFVQATHHRLPFFFAVLGLAVAIVGEVRGDHVRCHSLLSLSHAQRPIVLFQAREYVVGEPGFMPKFKRDLNPFGQRRHEGA